MGEISARAITLCPPCGSIVQIINTTKFPEAIPLVRGVEYEIFGTGAPDYCRNEIH